jgi:type IV pilus assembly protein PilC
MQMKLLNFTKRITTRELSVFFRQFATLIAAGIPIINACTMLEASQPQPQLYKFINSIKHDLLSGKTLSTSLRRHPQHINALIHQLVHISEHTGKLETILQTIASQLEKKLLFREQIQRALFYPCIIATTGMIVTLAMLLFIVPRFAELFHDMPGAIPPFTQAIFALSSFARHASWALLSLPLVTYFIWHYRRQTWLTHVPWIKSHLRYIQLAHFTRHLGITLSAGIPIATALSLVAQTSHDALFLTTLKQLGRQVRCGMQLHRAMHTSNLFSPLLIQMTKTGEEVGQIDHMLLKTADIMDADIERVLNRFSQLLEPLIMIVLGVLIGGLVTGMYLPIFKLGSII